MKPLKNYKNGNEFDSSKHMQKIADKKRLEMQREQNHHDNNRNSYLKLEWDKKGYLHVVRIVT